MIAILKKLTAYQRHFHVQLEYAKYFSKNCNLIEIEYSSGDTVAKFTFKLRTVSNVKENTIILIKLGTNFSYENPFRFSDKVRPLMILNYSCDTNLFRIEITSERVRGGTFTVVQIITRREVKKGTYINFSLLISNAIIPLGERKPFERYALSLILYIPAGYFVKETIIVEKYYSRLRSRFTKGNFLLETYPKKKGEKYIKIYLYQIDDSNKGYLALMHGVGEENPVDYLDTFIPLLSISLSFLAVYIWMMYKEISLFMSVMISSLLLTGRILYKFAYVQFHLSFKKGQNLQAILAFISIIIMILNIIIAIYSNNFNLYPLCMIYNNPLAIFIIFFTSLIAFFLAYFGLWLGFWQKYNCDMPLCDNYLRLRSIRYKHCPIMGLIICKKCWKTICKRCKVFEIDVKNTMESSRERLCVKMLNRFILENIIDD